MSPDVPAMSGMQDTAGVSGRRRFAMGIVSIVMLAAGIAIAIRYGGLLRRHPAVMNMNMAARELGDNVSRMDIRSQKVRVSSTATCTFFGVLGSVQAKYALLPMSVARGKPEDRADELSPSVTIGPRRPEGETRRAET